MLAAIFLYFEIFHQFLLFLRKPNSSSPLRNSKNPMISDCIFRRLAFFRYLTTKKIMDGSLVFVKKCFENYEISIGYQMKLKSEKFHDCIAKQKSSRLFVISIRFSLLHSLPGGKSHPPPRPSLYVESLLTLYCPKSRVLVWNFSGVIFSLS